MHVMKPTGGRIALKGLHNVSTTESAIAQCRHGPGKWPSTGIISLVGLSEISNRAVVVMAADSGAVDRNERSRCL